MTDQHPNTYDRETLLALLDASQSVLGELELSEVFRRIAKHATHVLNADASSVLLYDADTNQLTFSAAVGPVGQQLIGEKFDAQLGIAGEAIKSKRAVIVDDARQNQNFFPGIDAKTQMRTRSVMAAPLMHRDQVLGVVEVLNPIGRDHFESHDLELFQLFANMISAAAANAKTHQSVVQQAKALRQSISSSPMIGQSATLTRVLELCKRVAQSDATVLLCGETGTGKELCSKSIHDFSKRADKAFIAINCAALPESLLESELFGHEKGAFTGAIGQKLGRFEMAHEGTLFLDEIGEISPAIQSKLLRVLEQREIIRVGGTQTISCNVRIIAATNRNLKAEVSAGRFREDLYYRLNVFPITLPPLRDRIDDLTLLIDHFIQSLSPKLGVQPAPISDPAMMAMMKYNWPGNIRELRNIIERCLLLASGETINLDHLPIEIAQQYALSDQSLTTTETDEPAKSRLAEHEKALILKALQETGWNQSAAARQLGISRDHLRYRVKKYNLSKPKPTSQS